MFFRPEAASGSEREERGAGGRADARQGARYERTDPAGRDDVEREGPVPRAERSERRIGLSASAEGATGPGFSPEARVTRKERSDAVRHT